MKIGLSSLAVLNKVAERFQHNMDPDIFNKELLDKQLPIYNLKRQMLSDKSKIGRAHV